MTLCFDLIWWFDDLITVIILSHNIHDQITFTLAVVVVLYWTLNSLLRDFGLKSTFLIFGPFLIYFSFIIQDQPVLEPNPPLRLHSESATAMVVGKSDVDIYEMSNSTFGNSCIHSSLSREGKHAKQHQVSEMIGAGSRCWNVRYWWMKMGRFKHLT